MKINTIFFCFFLGLISCSTALAGYYDFYSPWEFCWGGYYQPSYIYASVPYYALHPPVYYSYKIDARSYGDSPFPYLPGMAPIQAYSLPPQPQMIRNEHVEESNLPSDQYQTHAPLRIPNPYVEQPGETGAPKGAKWEGKKTPKPLVVYPMEKSLWTQREKSVSYQPLR